MRINSNLNNMPQMAGNQQLQRNSGAQRVQNEQRRRLINELNSSSEKKEDYSQRIIADSRSYAQSLQTARASKKDAALQTKKVKYNYKAISTQISRAKTSVSAKQVVIKAKRLVSQLKRQMASGEYDEDEIKAAIDHAKAMERVAKKKVNHLVEEEMAKASGGACLGDRIEEDRPENEAEELEKAELEASDSEEEAGMQDAGATALQQVDYEEVDFSQQVVDDMMSAAMEEFASDMEAAMSEMLEEDLMEDLQDSLGVVVQKDMDPADYDMMKLKHRTKEQKEMAEADSKYLKAVFDKLQEDKEKAVAAASTQTSGGTGNSTPQFYNQLGGVVAQESAPGMEGAFTGGINICI